MTPAAWFRAFAHLLGDRKPFVRIDVETGAPGLPVHPARELAVGQIARRTVPTRLRDHQHRLHLLPRCCVPVSRLCLIFFAVPEGPHPPTG
jgi:hypothetical protein